MHITIEKRTLAEPPVQAITVGLGKSIHIMGQAVEEIVRTQVAAVLDNVKVDQVVSYDLIDSKGNHFFGAARVLRIDREEKSVGDKIILDFHVALSGI